MTAKEKLRQVVDELSELEAEKTLAFITSRRERDPVIAAFEDAPYDDEPTTPEEDATAAAAWESRHISISHDEVEYLGPDEPSIEQQLAEQGKTGPTDLSGIEPLFASEDERREFLALIGRDA